ncbi:MAG TPA: hypothetical protein VKD04_00750 [Burkholderiales bacterium]|nr:hypothetical protein [Burkholderiales bacterium]
MLAAVLAIQLALKAAEPRPTATALDLPDPPPSAALQLAAIGEPIATANLLSLYLQAFDNQPGISIPFKDLDYAKVESWLTRILDLDPPGQYPLMMASQVYGQVLPDPKKQRQMVEFVYRQFLIDPNRRWRWLAHAAIMAKHRLKDPELALRLARALTEHATASSVPDWAKQMHIFVLEDMGEIETVKILLGGLLVSGTITDSHEIHFLTERLKALQSAENSSTTSKR